MDRVVLLALLALPVLVVLHVALFPERLPEVAAVDWMRVPDGSVERPRLQGHWRLPEQATPANFVIVTKTEQGS